MASSPPRAPRRFLFDLNVAQEEVEEEEPMEVLEEEGAPVAQPEEAVVEEVAEQLVEHAVPTVEEEEPVEEVIMEEEPSEEVIMEEEEEEPAPAPAGEGKGRQKRIDYEVFVSGLPQDAAEEDVAKALAEAGDVEEVRLVRDPADQRLKGFAFVRFAAAWQARWAANDLREATVMTSNLTTAIFRFAPIARLVRLGKLVGESCELTDVELIEPFADLQRRFIL
jgi:hypothetical protein